ncbi:hypothetical protein M2277_004469 [Paenibacillus sp. LBL]|nr:hypothetical protein [Paenibacillus sp. LBL]
MIGYVRMLDEPVMPIISRVDAPTGVVMPIS